MGKAEKVPQLAEVFADDQNDQDSSCREAKRQEAAVLVEDFVAERGIGTLDSLLNLAKAGAKAGDVVNARKASRLANEIPRDARLLHEEVRRFLNT